MNNVIYYTKKSIEQYLSKRDNETKLGEALSFSSLSGFKGKYVILGIPEDIGPQANHGNPGAKNGWNAFLNAFLNIQANGFINAQDILLLGEISIEKTNSKQSLYDKVSIIDDLVFPIIEKIKQNNKIPIVIGGGHNNAYPIIKGCSLAKTEPISVLNIDPHADLRALEGRHSGNGFSYALEHQYLNKYFVLGLHEQYNAHYMLEKFSQNDNLSFLSFEDILRHDVTNQEIIKASLRFLDDPTIGLEIDLDAIANMPTSAYSPSGFSVEQIRKLIYQLSKQSNFEYLHLAEGAPTNSLENKIVGKTLSYLVSDFIKANN